MLFEKARGCKFHRDPLSLKCRITPLGKWKEWLTQDNVPLPFHQISHHLEVLGVTIFESWSKTRQTAGEILKKKIKNIRDAWRGGRFYDFLLRPHTVNTYMFSNVWHQASCINMLCCNMEKIQSEGNDYVYADCYMRPEKAVNYLKKHVGGLDINHVKSKARALFVKNLLEETNSNIYLDAVVRKYCKNEDVSPVPVKPTYMDKRLISTINLVLENTQRFSTKYIYNILLRNEFNITDNFRIRIETVYRDFDLKNALQFTYSRILPISVRSHMWKLIHRINYSEIEEAKVKLTTPSCNQCGEEDIDRVHLYFRCEKFLSISTTFMRILRVFDPQFTLEEVLEFKAMEEHPQLFWFIACTLFYIDKNKLRGNMASYRAFLWTEYETLKLSKYADEEMLCAIIIMLELVDEE